MRSDQEFKHETKPLCDEDPEVKSEKGIPVNVLKVETNPIDKLIEHSSSWYKLKRLVAWLILIKDKLKAKDKDYVDRRITVKLLNRAEHVILQHVQCTFLEEEYNSLKGSSQVKKSSSIYKLSPILINELICVGGRLQTSNIPDFEKHQIIIPKDSRLNELVVRDVHEKGHTGTEHTLARVRRKYWLIKGRVKIRNYISKCVTCKKLYGKVSQQKMAPLPSDRLDDTAPPFTYTGADCFGPFLVKLGRKTVKRWACLFTCLVMRAVHVEVINCLDASSMIQAIQRFAARRGKPKVIRSDNGTNFHAADRELRKAVKEMLNDDKLKNYLIREDIEIIWKFNTPAASHHGGAWERLIRSVRRALSAVIRTHSVKTHLDEEQLSTLFCLAEAIVNDRPITRNSDTANDLEALTPNHILLLRRGMPFLGKDEQVNVYGRRWRQVQSLASQFWSRWRREYLPDLQIRQKNSVPQANVKVDDLVLLLDDQSPRSKWPLGRIEEVIEGRDGLIRTVRVRTQKGCYARPITKIVSLEDI